MLAGARRAGTLAPVIIIVCVIIIRVIIIRVIIHPVLVVHEHAFREEGVLPAHGEVVDGDGLGNVVDGSHFDGFLAVEEGIPGFQILHLYPLPIGVEGVFGGDADGAVQHIVAVAPQCVDIGHRSALCLARTHIERAHAVAHFQLFNRPLAIRKSNVCPGEETAVLVVHEEVLREVVVLLVYGEVVDGDGLGNVLDGSHLDGLLAVEEGITGFQILHLYPLPIGVEGVFGGDADGAVQHIVAVALEGEDLGNGSFGAPAGYEIIGEDRIACLQGFDGLRAARGGDNSAGEEAAVLVVHEHVRCVEGIYAFHLL